QNDFADAGNARWYSSHEDAAGIDGPAARGVYSDTTERIGTPAHSDAGLRRDFAWLWKKGAMDACDVVGGAKERTTQRRIKLIPRSQQLGSRNLELSKINAVKVAGKVQKC